MWLSSHTIFDLFKIGMILDGRAGGLIIGKPSDGISVLQESEDDKYTIAAKFENGEYLINHAASLRHRKRLEEINAEQHPEVDKLRIPITSYSRIINTSANPDDKFLLIDRKEMFIINRRSTAKYFDELEFINNNPNLYSAFSTAIFEQRKI